MCKEIKVNKVNVEIDRIDRMYACQDCGHTISSSMEDGTDAHRRAQDFAFRHVEETGHTVHGILTNHTVFFKEKDKPKEMAQRITIRKSEQHIIANEVVWHCKNCDTIEIRSGNNYCPVCGIRLKWED